MPWGLKHPQAGSGRKGKPRPREAIPKHRLQDNKPPGHAQAELPP